ncbi:hypothetical protein FGIG_03982 [Fasciola gigantica]|uniref:Uncharacterized protein n=1 Tax=Fasciola gigantica TaxID=46835 RepID=A0A504X075_FASGI|nr:hypothetical protein FGIG_03982 [Fasciola gigantica]
MVIIAFPDKDFLSPPDQSIQSDSPKDDLISFSLPSALGVKRVVRYHSADSLRSVPMEEFTEKTASSSRSGATRSPSRARNPKTIAQEIVGLMPTVNETEANLGSIAYTLSGGGSKYALVHPTSVNPAEPKCDLYLDGAGGLRGKLLRPSTNAMCDAIMAFANLIEQPHDDADDVGATNQALNAMTYPSSQNAYHLDIERLVRGKNMQFGEGMPVCHLVCRSRVNVGSHYY